MRQALARLFRSVELNVEVFGSTTDLLRHKFPDAPSCLVLDVQLPGLSGLDFQDELARAGIAIPIIFMTGHGDIPMSGAGNEGSRGACLAWIPSSARQSQQERTSSPLAAAYLWHVRLALMRNDPKELRSVFQWYDFGGYTFLDLAHSG
jgi:CheY-like chemotaxis protein